ncbi:YceD family protein [Pleionea sediminis]|uniref:YceD family protein n=1 Tax=Pleionea sediminis TaxID=2569479 RepID=UPI001184E3E0|nr:YceD family protein [Pleionea sediminis]
MKKADVYWSINPFKLAENAASTERRLPVASLERFASFLSDDSGEINVVFSGLKDEDGRKLLKCSLSGVVTMECQTSFESVPVILDRDLVFYPVLTEEAIAAAPEQYEAFLHDQDELDLVSLVEDELILSLPMSINSSESPKRMSFGPKLESQEAKKKPNPFEVLAQLKQIKQNSED